MTRRESAQSAIELAVMLPVLMLIVLGCLDLGRAFSVRMALANATREGARIASQYPFGYQDPETGWVTSLDVLVRERTKEDVRAQGLDVDDSKLNIEVGFVEEPQQGSPIKVTATYTLQLFTSFIFGGRPVVIRAANDMAIIGGP